MRVSLAICKTEHKTEEDEVEEEAEEVACGDKAKREKEGDRDWVDCPLHS